MQLALGFYVRLFAPVLPFVTEEVWSWWQEGSVHRTAWPTRSEIEGHTGDPEMLEAVSAVLREVRRTKSEAKTSMRAPVERIEVAGEPDFLDLVRSAQADLVNSTNANSIEYREGEPSVRAELAQA